MTVCRADPGPDIRGTMFVVNKKGKENCFYQFAKYTYIHTHTHTHTHTKMEHGILYIILKWNTTCAVTLQKFQHLGFSWTEFTDHIVALHFFLISSYKNVSLRSFLASP